MFSKIAKLKQPFWISKRDFIKLPTFSNKIRYNDTATVACPQELIYGLVADVDNYYKFVPNVFASKILRRPTPDRMEASLSIGIPKMVQAEYTSTIHLQKPRRILIQSQPNDFAKFIESEWIFEPAPRFRSARKSTKISDKTLVRFRVEFELYSQLTANILNLVLDDFTRKTMLAFIQRAETLHRQRLKSQ